MLNRFSGHLSRVVNKSHFDAHCQTTLQSTNKRFTMWQRPPGPSGKQPDQNEYEWPSLSWSMTTGRGRAGRGWDGRVWQRLPNYSRNSLPTEYNHFNNNWNFAGQQSGFASNSYHWSASQNMANRSFDGCSYGQYSEQKCRDEIKNLIKKYRTWHLTESGRRWKEKEPGNGLKFRLMTYNVLAQNLLNDHLYLYQRCDQKCLEWPERGHRIIRELEKSHADIICLQEVNEKDFEQVFWPSMRERGYDKVYKKRTGNKQDGCAVLFNTKKFSVESSAKVEFHRMDISNSLNRDNIGLILVLKPLKSELNETKLIVATTHLLYNPKRGDVKLAQLRLLFAEIDKAALKGAGQEQAYHPIILCGDMNAEVGSPLYSFITNGEAKFEGIRSGDIGGQSLGKNRGFYMGKHELSVRGLTPDCKYEEELEGGQQQDASSSGEILRHNFKFHSVYSSDRNIVSSNIYSELGLVDYIFYSQNDNLQLLGYKKLLTDRQMNEIGCLPNAYLGSDHLSLCAKFCIH